MGRKESNQTNKSSKTCVVGTQKISMRQGFLSTQKQMSRDMRFPTMWYLQLAKAQISLRIDAA